MEPPFVEVARRSNRATSAELPEAATNILGFYMITPADMLNDGLCIGNTDSRFFRH